MVASPCACALFSLSRRIRYYEIPDVSTCTPQFERDCFFFRPTIFLVFREKDGDTRKSWTPGFTLLIASHSLDRLPPFQVHLPDRG